MRPIGGLLADKVGGAIVTFWNFIAMAAATIGVLYFVGIKDFTGFLVMFLILFATTGIGNGSTYRMIPSIFREENLHKARGKGEAARAEALKTASIESGAAVGFIGAIGAVRRLPDPARLRQVDRADRRSAARADDLPRLLRDLPRHDLVVLPAQGSGDRGRAEPRRSAHLTSASLFRRPVRGAKDIKERSET